MSERLDEFVAESVERIDRYLDKVLPPADEPPTRLHEAMRYAVFSGGKRLRPALAFAAAQAVGAEPERALPAAAAAELVHSYSMVHDDLPSMDDDDERRGRPTLHVRWDEALAILVGDALLSEAFAELGRGGAPGEVVARLGALSGSRGLVGGQVDDLAFRSAAATLDNRRFYQYEGAIYGFNYSEAVGHWPRDSRHSEYRSIKQRDVLYSWTVCDRWTERQW